MTRFDRLATAALAAGILLAAGCHKKEISDTDRMAAANAYSDAQFATSIKEWPRAETSALKAAQLCPDTGDYWIEYGIIEVKLGKKSDAKSAYSSAIDAYKAAYKADKDKNLGAVQQEAFAYLLLGRRDDAKQALIQAAKDHPDNKPLNDFVNSSKIDGLLDDPRVKDLGI